MSTSYNSKGCQKSKVTFNDETNLTLLINIIQNIKTQFFCFYELKFFISVCHWTTTITTTLFHSLKNIISSSLSTLIFNCCCCCCCCWSEHYSLIESELKRIQPKREIIHCRCLSFWSWLEYNIPFPLNEKWDLKRKGNCTCWHFLFIIYFNESKNQLLG